MGPNQPAEKQGSVWPQKKERTEMLSNGYLE